MSPSQGSPFEVCLSVKNGKIRFLFVSFNGLLLYTICLALMSQTF